jgi:acyl-coenzyme A thioesterase PaaI-like protein
MAAVATVTFTVLPAASSSHVPDPTLDVPSLWTNADQVPVEMTTDDFVGVRPQPGDGAAGPVRYEMDLATHLRNLNGVLHGGGLVLFAEHAALLAAAARGTPRPLVDDIDVHFLAPATVGPVVGTASVVGDRDPNAGGERLTLLVEATDEGQDDRLVGVALVGVTPRQ